MKCREASKEVLSRNTCTIVTSYKCNLKCPHCKVGELSTDPEWLNNEIPVEDIINFIELNKFEVLNITGGEPFLDANREKTYALIQKGIDMKCKIITINTNGTIPIPDFNFECPDTLIQFTVSLDGLEKEHDALRGPGIFNKTTAFMREMIDKGYYVSARYTILDNPTPEELSAYVRYIKKNNLVNGVIMLRFLRNVGRAEVDGDSFIKRFMEDPTFPREKFRDWCEANNVYLQSIVQCNAKDRDENSAYCVDPHGNLLPCSNLPHVSFGNITSFDKKKVYDSMVKYWTGRSCYGVNIDLKKDCHNTIFDGVFSQTFPVM